MVKSDHPLADKILKKMCKIVGADYNTMDFRSPDWFNKHSWTTKEEDRFFEWLAKYFFEHWDAVSEIFKYVGCKNKKNARKYSLAFVANYRWKSK